MKPLIQFLTIATIVSPALHGATIALAAADGFNASSFALGTNWTGGGAPGPGNDYTVGILRLRSPADGNSYTFGGDSLSINSGGVFSYKGVGTTGIITVNNLILNGGLLDHINGPGDIFNLAGNVNIAANSQIHAKQGVIRISATINGSSTITNPGADGPGRRLIISSSTNTFTGSIVNNGEFEFANGSLMNYSIGASGVNNSVSGTGTIFLNGLFSLNLTGAGTNLGDNWTLVNNGSLNGTYGSTFGINGFTDIGGDQWSQDIGGGLSYLFQEGSGVLTVIPEPSATLLGGLGMLVLLRRRRGA